MKKFLSELEALIKSNDGFSIIHKYSAEKIESFEKQYNWNLPIDYKSLLSEIGIFKYSYGSYEDEFQFIGLENIKPWSQEVFPETENLFPQILLIATSVSGENFGFIKGQSELFVFNPECPCYLWLEDQLAKYPFEKWIQKITESKMERIW